MSNSSRRNPAMKWHLSALAAACAVLSGCAALQIDVDVYKGPLVHDEETQVQQLASIAMSGKAVMLLRRNNWLRELKANWDGDMAGNQALRTRHISKGEWQQLGLQEVCDKQMAQVALCRNTRLINDMLSAYEDRTEPELALPMELVGDNYQSYKRAREAFRTTKDETLKASKLEEANKALNRTWGVLVDLLQNMKAATPPEDKISDYRATERQVADILARMTEPTLLACTPDLKLAGDIKLAVDWVNDNAHKLNKEAVAKSGSDQLALAFRSARASDLPELRKAATRIIPVTGGECQPFGKTASLQLKTTPRSQSVAVQTPPGSAARGPSTPVAHQGVQREATSSNEKVLDEDLRDIDAMVGALLQFGASGFDRGRPRLGLDRLADDAATERFERRKRGRDEVDALADSRQAKQLHDSVVDLASRMQFLAVNMRLVDGTSSDTEAAFKSTLETIANTLLVLTEDQRRQRQHREQLKDSAEEEYAAAVDAFKLDSGRRFDQLTSALSTRLAKVRGQESEDTASTQQKAELTDTRTTARATLKMAEETLASSSAAPQALVALLVTLDGEGPKNAKSLASATQAAVMAKSKDPAAKWKADKSALDATLKAVAAKTTVQALRDAVFTWLEAAFVERDSPATKTDASQLRLHAAKTVLETFKTAGVKEMAKADALKAMRQELSDAWDQQHKALVEAEAAVNTARSALDQVDAKLLALEQAAKSKRVAEGEALASAEIDAALKLVRAQRAAVVAEAAASKGAHDVTTIRDLVYAKLEQGKSAAPADKVAAHQAAMMLVSQWASSPPVTLKPGNSPKPTAVDTLDRVEAYLSYARVEATQRGGAAGDGVKEASEAMAALMQRRERMSYLRPASMYLRSALATTGQQANPALEWSNLLAATVKRLLSQKDVEAQKTAAVRADLDKSFWQSVNQVRVSAGGDSNFAIAKDDVGNWYVKAMGADSAAMISAAKNLALYNMGGRIDTNLLRIDELRNKPDRLASDPNDTELQDLLNRKNVATATAYGSTLQVFSDNHTKSVKALQASLDETLKLQAHFDQLRARWIKTYADSAAKRDAVKQALADPALLSLHDKALTAVAPVDPQPVGTTPSSQLLETLDLLAQQRARIKSLLAQIDSLTKEEALAAETQNKVVADQEALLTAAQNEQANLLQKRLELQEQIDKLPNDRKAEADLLTRDRDDKQKLANDKGLQVVALRTKLLEARAAAGRLNTVAASAQALKARALDDVDSSLHKLVKNTAAKHLRAVEEFETAARVVSQGVQGKSGKP